MDLWSSDILAKGGGQCKKKRGPLFLIYFVTIKKGSLVHNEVKLFSSQKNGDL